MVEFFLFVNSNESTTGAAAVPDVVVSLVEENLGVEPGNALVLDGNVIVGVPTHHPALAFERVKIGVGDLALLDN